MSRLGTFRNGLWPVVVIAVAALAYTSHRVFGAAGGDATTAPQRVVEPAGTLQGEYGEPITGARLGGWLWPAILAVTAVLMFAGYRIWFAGGTGEATAETVSVSRATIRSTIEASASVDSQEAADLSFALPGRVEHVNVQLGDRVEPGQTLAMLESDTMDNAVRAASANVELAQLKLTQLLNGASNAEIAAAEQAVSGAQSTRDRAAEDLRELEAGADAEELDRARAAVTRADAELAEREAALDRLLDGASQSDIATAEASVASARAALSSAEQAEVDVQAQVSAARGKLYAARADYCAQPASRPEVCGSTAAPLPQSAVDLLLSDAAASSDAGLTADVSSLLSANASLVAANQEAVSASDAAAVAEANVAAAEEALEGLLDGAEPPQIDAAEAAVVAARDAQAAARAALTEVENGASPEDLDLGRSVLSAADAAVMAAEAKLADLIDGADYDDIAIQQAQIRAAEIALERAAVEQGHAHIIAPFGGVVAAVNVQPGEYAAPGVPALVLLTPGALRLKLVIGENDRPYVHPGLTGTLTLEALPNQTFPFTIERVGDAPTIEQGVAIYTAEAFLPVSGSEPRPVPGISGVAEVLIEEKEGVLAIPARALRRIGRSYVVDVMANGTVEEREVQPGISDGQYVEIVSGLDEGEQIVLRAVTSSAPQALPTRERRLPGDIR
jgi:HlyD family secretion protein